MKKILLICLALFFLVPTLTQAQKKKKKNKGKTEISAKSQKSKDKDAIKKYSEVITKEAISDKGLFDVHKVKKSFYYEIPFSTLNKEMMWVSRVAQIPAGLGGGFFNAGTKTNQQVVHWTRFQDKILLKVKSFRNVADSTKAISESVRVNNYEPTLFAFNIKAFNNDSTAVVIDVTKLFSTDVLAISGLPNRLRKLYKVKRLDPSRSFINSMKSFPQNIEVRQDFTYDASEPPSSASTGCRFFGTLLTNFNFLP